MRLINVETFELEDFVDETRVPYTILSHRWENEEVLFEHMAPRGQYQHLMKSRHAWNKVQRCCQQARIGGYKYLWIDTCCINKESSAELQEAINSMFRWYQKAAVCYAYLSDVDSSHMSSFDRSEWFRRGWTLQELLAPSTVWFFDASWKKFGERSSLTSRITSITGIQSNHLSRSFNFQSCRTKSGRNTICCAQLMSWASQRRTTRAEDQAYCLMGLFDINMPLLYGEGSRAFQRLQEAIFIQTSDLSLLLWTGVQLYRNNLLAPSTAKFSRGMWDHKGYNSHEKEYLSHSRTHVTVRCRLTSLGPNLYSADLIGCESMNSVRTCVGIYLERKDEVDEFIRVTFGGQAVFTHPSITSQSACMTRPSRLSTVRILRHAILARGSSDYRLPAVILSHPRCPFRVFEGTAMLPHTLAKFGHSNVLLSPERSGLLETINITTEESIVEKRLAHIYVGFDQDYCLTYILNTNTSICGFPGFRDPVQNVLQTTFNANRPMSAPISVPETVTVLAQQGGIFTFHESGIYSFRYQYPSRYDAEKNSPHYSRILVQISGQKACVVLMQIHSEGFRKHLWLLNVRTFPSIADYQIFDLEQASKDLSTLIHEQMKRFSTSGRSSNWHDQTTLQNEIDYAQDLTGDEDQTTQQTGQSEPLMTIR